MKILIFIEGTILVHKNSRGLTRDEIVKQVKEKEPSVREYSSYFPIGNAPEKIQNWKDGGSAIIYLTSRTAPEEVAAIRCVLEKYRFPKGELVYRRNGETYANVAERITPDILIEDDCESIGGEVEMTYPHIRSDLRTRIKSIVVKEFSGIDHLPDNLSALS